LLILSRVREPGSDWPDPGQWLGAAVVGTLFFVFCHGLLAREEQHVPSGIAALCLATIPLFVPLLAWIALRSGHPSLRTALALLAACAGVAWLVAGQGAGGGLSATDAALLLFTAFAWAAGTIASRRVPLPHAPLATAAAPLLAGGVLLTLLSIVTGEAGQLHPSQGSARSLGGLLCLLLMGTVATLTADMW